MTTIGVIIVDHGSRRPESNALLPVVAEQLKRATGWRVVEHAHMELAEPSIAAAFAKCVEQGADHIIVHPYFLGPGRHWSEDIPALTAEASEQRGGVTFQVTPPLGPHELLVQIARQRIEAAMAENDRGAAEI